MIWPLLFSENALIITIGGPGIICPKELIHVRGCLYALSGSGINSSREAEDDWGQ
jgi:hypothetical protein